MRTTPLALAMFALSSPVLAEPLSGRCEAERDNIFSFSWIQFRIDGGRSEASALYAGARYEGQVSDVRPHDGGWKVNMELKTRDPDPFPGADYEAESVIMKSLSQSAVAIIFYRRTENGRIADVIDGFEPMNCILIE